MEYSIKELSRMAGVSTRTLRYYQQTGLLQPARTTGAGYRYYGEKEAALLQQILFYRERGFELKTIQKILYDQDFDCLEAMQAHLQALQARKEETEALITTVEKTIRYMKGEYPMQTEEKFRGMREKLLRENEEKYGAEARETYGAEQVEAANSSLKHLSREQFTRWQELDREILQRLEAGAAAGLPADSEEARQIVRCHTEWLILANPQYSPRMHRGIAAMYVADERFAAYYDRNISGCARLLWDAVMHWISD